MELYVCRVNAKELHVWRRVSSVYDPLYETLERTRMHRDRKWTGGWITETHEAS